MTGRAEPGLGMLLLFFLLVAGCVTTGAMREMSAQELEERWRKSPQGTRMAIVEERKVPEASGQDQHPVRKGETQGELVIGRVH